MNPMNEIQKDVLQFARERRTLLLLVAAPILVLAIMSAVFSGDSTLPKQVSIGVCDLDNSNASSLFIAGLANNSDVRSYPAAANCSAVLESDVRAGHLAAGLAIPNGFEDGIRQGVSQNISLF
ncbi:MAG: ABC transporter permease, partial [Candidatus Micrarchaeota archaeon]|nr:ABC transporter permease [Candidatus Micrarchaeota archaeon]